MFRIITNKLLKNNTPRWVVLLIDIYIVSNTFLLAYLIRFNFQLTFDVSKLVLQLPFIIVTALISFLIVGSYKGIIRHTGLRDSINISIANTFILVLLGSLVLLNRRFNINNSFTIPLSIIVIHFLLNTIILITSRYLFKELYLFLISDFRVDKRALIYGAGEAGILTSSVLKDDKASKVQIIGFIDDYKGKIGKKINGIEVLSPKSITPNYIIQKNIDEIILSIQNIESSRLIEIVDSLSKLPIKVKIVPPAKDWIDNNLKSNQIKGVAIEDLLGRAPIDIKNPLLFEEFNNKVVLITGASGSIGSEIARQLSNFNCKQIILIDQAESELYKLQQYFKTKSYTKCTSIVADIRNQKRLNLFFEKYQPSFVFHAAAYKHVPFMEENPYEAICTNVLGTKIVAELAIKHQVEKFVMISTDKAVNPTNIMGASKRIAEMQITSLHKKGITKFITTRFGNVLGSNGSVIPLFQSQIKNGGPLTVTHKDITRYFMTIPEACQLVLEAGVMGKGGEIFVFDMGKSIKIYDLALNMIHLSGLNYPNDIDIIITGLRPGEKIYEELLADGETTKETYHPKIKIAKVKPLDSEITAQKINELCTCNGDFNDLVSIAKMKELVPEFISNNSKYEALDK